MDHPAADESAQSSETSGGGTSTGSTAPATTSPVTTAPHDTSTTGETSEGTSGGSTGEALQRCGIDDLAPDASNPLVASDRVPMQLPIEIADILTRSCGCHLADDLVIPGDYPSTGMLDLTTWPAWHAPFGDEPTYEAARNRLDPAVPIIIMPPHTCNVGDGETMLPEDRARLLEWIVALAPDGVTWSQG
jgi:hypothetical protein